MDKKCDPNSSRNDDKIRLDLSKKNPHEIVHLVSVLRRLEKEGKIKIRVII